MLQLSSDLDIIETVCVLTADTSPLSPRWPAGPTLGVGGRHRHHNMSELQQGRCQSTQEATSFRIFCYICDNCISLKLYQCIYCNLKFDNWWVKLLMKRKELQGNLFPVNTTSAFNNKTKVRGDDAQMLKTQRDNSKNSNSTFIPRKFGRCRKVFYEEEVGAHPSLNLRIGSDLKQTSLIDVWYLECEANERSGVAASNQSEDEECRWETKSDREKINWSARNWDEANHHENEMSP